MTPEQIYIRIDADNVGDKLELLLIAGDVAGALQLSMAVQDAMQKLQEQAITAGFHVLFGGCDDILLTKPLSSYEQESLEGFRSFFFEKTGCTLSCGVGLNLSNALQNLRIAKLSGKNRIVEQPFGSL